MSEPTMDPGPTSTSTREHPTRRRASRPVGWIAPAALVLSLLAAAAGGWALLKPPPPRPGIFATNPIAADPKAEACKVALLVAQGVALQSRTDLGQDPVALETVAANTRLAMAGGAAYLRDFTPSNTPAELSEPMATLANQLQDIAQHFFVGETGTAPEQADRMKAATDTTTKLAEVCR